MYVQTFVYPENSRTVHGTSVYRAAKPEQQALALIKDRENARITGPRASKKSPRNVDPAETDS